MQKERVVIVTQHVKNIATLSDEQNSHLQSALEEGDPAAPDADARKESEVASKNLSASSDNMTQRDVNFA